jgi:aspartyl-tRNA(Asn)/glutamyl-tRNA(Gln) amidotransferase subunit A
VIELYEQTRGEGFGKEVKRRILLGTFVLSSGYYEAYYGHAQKVRTLIRKDLERAFEVCDLILTPTTPTPPFPIGSKMEDPLAMYLSDIYTNACNLGGVPGIAYPVGFTREGLPIGAQLMAPPGRDELLLQYVNAYQESTSHHKKIPRGILDL